MFCRGTQWVSWWSEDRFAFTTTHYIGAYLGFALSQLVLVFFAAIMMSYTIVKTANVMHDAAFERVLFSPLAFFDTTPLGRIINRYISFSDRAIEPEGALCIFSYY